MVETLLAVVVGGLISLASQAAVDRLHATQANRIKLQENVKILQVMAFRSYTVQQAIREMLETGRWQPGGLDFFELPTDENLRAVASGLPILGWQYYTGVIRRLWQCSRLQAAYGQDSTSPVTTTDLMLLLSTFVVLDSLRQHVNDEFGIPAAKVHLKSIAMSPAQIQEALESHAGIWINRSNWLNTLLPMATKTN